MADSYDWQPQRLELHGAVIERYPSTPAPGLLPRHIDVWRPAGVEEQRLPVLYMHDGQNLFDPALSFTGVPWGCDTAIEQLLATGRIPGGVMVVGIWNTPQRKRDYMPEAPMRALEHRSQLADFSAAHGGPPQSDAYIRWLASVVKPMIDARYPTLADAAHTAVMGSSMGGLISMYALCQYPAIFGLAGCLSTHWPIGGTALVDWFGGALPTSQSHRIYFDYGTAGLDASYGPFQTQMDWHMRRAGYREGDRWRTLCVPGAEHTEQAWRDRLATPLEFLFGSRLS